MLVAIHVKLSYWLRLSDAQVFSKSTRMIHIRIASRSCFLIQQHFHRCPFRWMFQFRHFQFDPFLLDVPSMEVIENTCRSGIEIESNWTICGMLRWRHKGIFPTHQWKHRKMRPRRSQSSPTFALIFRIVFDFPLPSCILRTVDFQLSNSPSLHSKFHLKKIAKPQVIQKTLAPSVPSGLAYLLFRSNIPIPLSSGSIDFGNRFWWLCTCMAAFGWHFVFRCWSGYRMGRIVVPWPRSMDYSKCSWRPNWVECPNWAPFLVYSCRCSRLAEVLWLASPISARKNTHWIPSNRDELKCIFNSPLNRPAIAANDCRWCANFSAPASALIPWVLWWAHLSKGQWPRYGPDDREMN